MFGAPFRSLKRPVLLIVVFGFFLTIVGLTALSQAIVVSTQSSQTMLSAIVGSDAATVRGFVNGYLLPADLEPGGLSAARAATLQAQLKTIDSAGEIMRIEVRLPDGTVLLSDTADPAGLRGESTPDFTAAADGTVTAGFHPVADAESVGAVLPANDVLRAYFPVKFNEKVVAVVGIWRDAAPILGDLDRLRRQVMIVTLFAGALAAIALYLVFRAAQRRILRQTDELLEATRLDPMTGTLNHGALVGVLAVAIEAARHAEETLGVALLDIDNFRNLNQTYGHPAGDEALTAVAALLRGVLPVETQWGRYGPDEFLVIVTPDVTTDLELTVEHVRMQLVDLSLQFDASERLPVTISAGICTFPINGESVTTLLSSASRTLDEAKVERRRQRPRRRGRCRAARGGRPVGRPRGPDHRRRHEGPLHTPALRGRRPLRRFPGARSSVSTIRSARSCTGPVASTTSARSASPTRSCASPVPSPRASTRR